MWAMCHYVNGERVCCHEYDQIINKLAENDSEVSCITQHEGFVTVCLNRWVLQAGYFQYRQRYGASDIRSDPVHEYVQYMQIHGCTMY